jgi:hypothetical protein
LTNEVEFASAGFVSKPRATAAHPEIALHFRAIAPSGGCRACGVVQQVLHATNLNGATIRVTLGATTTSKKVRSAPRRLQP